MTTTAPSRYGRRRLAGLSRLATPVLEALTHPHGPDRYLQLVDPTWSSREVRGRVVDVRHPAPDTVTLLVRPNHLWAGFRAGQHVQLGIEVDGAWRRRCYSIVTSEHDHGGLLEFSARIEPDGLVSPRLQALVPGAVVLLSQAQGPFMLPERRPDHLLLAGGGSGITPVLSMLRTLVDEGRADTVTFLHYARSPEAVAYRADLADLAAANPGLRIDVHDREQFTPEHLDGIPDAPTWACGPAGFVEALRSGRGSRTAPLHVEHFTPPSPVLGSLDGEPTGEVRFTASGVAAPNSGATLLEQAEAAGLKPASGCRMGICWTCTRRKTDGPVRNLRTGAVSTEPDTDIQLCITAPCGDVRIDL